MKINEYTRNYQKSKQLKLKEKDPNTTAISPTTYVRLLRYYYIMNGIHKS